MPPQPWPRWCQSHSPSKVFDILGHVVERGVAIDLVGRGVEEGVTLIGAVRRDVSGPDHPEGDALLATGVDVPPVTKRHLGVRGVERADVDMRETALAAYEDLPQRPAAFGRVPFDCRRTHATYPSCWARTFLAAYALAASRTHAPSLWAPTRCSIRSALQAPSPLMTRQNSLQSMAPNSQCPVASLNLRSGSGSVSPIFCACGTVMSTNFCRRASLLKRLMPHAMDCSVCPPEVDASPVSGGPNIINAGHHQRFTASWAMSFCAWVPRIKVHRISNPCRWWNDSSLQTRIIARA